MKVCGHHEEIDGYWCFVEVLRGEEVIHSKVPIEQHARELTVCKKRLHDVVTMDSRDFIKCYGH